MPTATTPGFEALEALAQSKLGRTRPLKVAFVSHQYTFWYNYLSVVRAMLQEPELFEPVVLLTPFVGNESKISPRIAHPADLDKCGFTVHTDESYNILEERPDLAFFYNPYSAQRSLRYLEPTLLDNGILPVMIPYATEFMGNQDFFSMYFSCYGHRYWRVFTSSSLSQTFYKLGLQATDAYAPVTGQPEYDFIINSKPEDLAKCLKIKKMAQGRKIILWAPHFKQESGWSTMRHMGVQMAKLFASRHKDFFVVLRPHQWLLPHVHDWSPGKAPQSPVQKATAILHEAGNFWLDDDPLAIESIFAANALIADKSSLLTKAMALGKSTLYLKFAGDNAGLGENILTHNVHNAANLKEVANFLDMLASGPDPLLPIPAAAHHAFCGPVDGKSGKRVAAYLKQYFFPNQASD